MLDESLAVFMWLKKGSLPCECGGELRLSGYMVRCGECYKRSDLEVGEELVSLRMDEFSLWHHVRLDAKS